MKTTAVFIMIFLPVVASAGTFEQTRRLELPVEAIQTLKIRCGSGFLTMIGVKGIDRISVTGQIEVRNITENEFQKYLEKQLLLGSKKNA